jgi:hypothetical protein
MIRNMYLKPNAAKPMIVYYTRGDVNGDGILDNVFLTGIKTPDSPFIQNITLVIQNGITGTFNRIVLKENAGYNPRIFLGDFTGNKVQDIQVTIDSGGSGAFIYSYIYSDVNNVPKLLFDSDTYNNTYIYAVKYLDNYKVEVISLKNNVKYIIDIEYKGKDYLNEIYDVNGRLKEPIEGFVNPVSGLYPVDFNRDGVYELLAYQKIAGRYNADALGYIQNQLDWDKEFVLQNQYVAIFGT